MLIKINNGLVLDADSIDAITMIDNIETDDYKNGYRTYILLKSGETIISRSNFDVFLEKLGKLVINEDK